MYSSIGMLRYQESNRLVVEIEQGLADYYRSLIPKWVSNNRPRWPAHITVVRAFKEVPLDFSKWGKYEGMPVPFFYESIVHCDETYFWLNAYCKWLEEIRVELGLSPVSRYTLPFKGFDRVFHITIANIK